MCQDRQQKRGDNISYSIFQTRRFSRQYKRLNNNIVVVVDEAIQKIAKDPKMGEKKKGDLAKLRVYKFYILKQLYLLGYSVDDEISLIYLEAIGVHENFYRDLKKK